MDEGEGWLHSMEGRRTRWLLMAQDRARADTDPLTQELLSLMLGTRRATVTVVAGIRQRAGLIRYGRGSVTILDQIALESASRACYYVMREALERVIAE
jgi:hypothetical protein